MDEVRFSEWLAALASADGFDGTETFLVLQGGVPKKATLEQVLDYVFDTGTSASANALAALIEAQTNPGANIGDTFFASRGGTPYKLTAQDILAATGGLDTATLDGTENVLVVQSGVAKTATVDDVNAA